MDKLRSVALWAMMIVLFGSGFLNSPAECALTNLNLTLTSVTGTHCADSDMSFPWVIPTYYTYSNTPQYNVTLNEYVDEHWLTISYINSFILKYNTLLFDYANANWLTNYGTLDDFERWQMCETFWVLRLWLLDNYYVPVDCSANISVFCVTNRTCSSSNVYKTSDCVGGNEFTGNVSALRWCTAAYCTAYWSYSSWMDVWCKYTETSTNITKAGKCVAHQPTCVIDCILIYTNSTVGWKTSDYFQKLFDAWWSKNGPIFGGSIKRSIGPMGENHATDVSLRSPYDANKERKKLLRSFSSKQSRRKLSSHQLKKIEKAEAKERLKRQSYTQDYSAGFCPDTSPTCTPTWCPAALGAPAISCWNNATTPKQCCICWTA